MLMRLVYKDRKMRRIACIVLAFLFVALTFSCRAEIAEDSGVVAVTFWGGFVKGVGGY